MKWRRESRRFAASKSAESRVFLGSCNDQKLWKWWYGKRGRHHEGWSFLRRMNSRWVLNDKDTKWQFLRTASMCFLKFTFCADAFPHRYYKHAPTYDVFPWFFKSFQCKWILDSKSPFPFLVLLETTWSHKWISRGIYTGLHAWWKHRAALKSAELWCHSRSYSSANGTSASQAAGKMWGKRLILSLAPQ